MTPSTLRCRGFTHPGLLLIRACLTQPPTISASRVWYLPPRPGQLSMRLFTTSRHVLAEANTALARPAQAKRTPAYAPARTAARPPAATGPAARGQGRGAAIGYAQKLAQPKNGTVLYDAAPSRVFLFTSYLSGFSLVVAAGVNMVLNVVYIPPGLPAWMPVLFSGVAFMMAILGTNFALKPANIVRSIRVLPFSAKPQPQQQGNSSPAAGGQQYSRPVKLEIMVRRSLPIPGLPLRRMEVDPSEVILRSRLFNPTIEPSEEQKIHLKKAEEERRKAERKYEMEHLLSGPFRHGWWATTTIFQRVRRGLTGEGFAPIEIQGYKYKLDVTSAYALEEGRALDRIVRIQEDAQSSQLTKMMYRK